MSTTDAASLDTALRMFVAASTLMVYDHFITIDQEMSCFWTGKWNVSRFLFISMRYLPEIDIVIIMFIYYGNVGFYSCKWLSYVVFVLCTLTLLLNQAALTLRVWYLFTRNRTVQNTVIVFAFACMTSTVIFAASVPDTRPEDIIRSTCDYTVNQRAEWRMYLPPVTLHITLYGLTLCKTLTSTSAGQIRGLTGMIIDEGAHLYLLATVALIFGLVGTAMSDDANVFVPASYSLLINAAISVSVARAMLGLRNLAARLHVDPGWLLSHSELSRVRYRPGLHDGELLVEINRG
ncbi:hypothetical protein DFH29DRAFT_893813 [Suillus ampliporus]|nr:hypothetical protein DFH29DRAFT_893813 [Suillus ampliporus]